MKVSAVIPVFNGAPWIAEAIGSVRQQRLPVHELIVVDDGSTDGSGALAQTLGADVIRLPENAGAAVARNAGLQRATGDVIAWLDADDRWSPDHTLVLASLLERFPQATVACAAVELFGLRSGVNTGCVPVGEPANVFWSAAIDWVHPIIGSAIRRQALIEIGGFATDSRSSEDYDMWLRLSREHLFVATREVTSHWRWHPKQQSQDYGPQIQAVYFYRRRYLDKELVTKHPEDAERFSAQMRSSWKEDFDSAFKANRLAVCKAVLDISDLVPDLEPSAGEARRQALLSKEKSPA